MDQGKRKRIAYHEAGHLLACYLVFALAAAPLRDATIRAGEGLLGHVRWADDFARDDDQENVEKEIMTLWGGAVAEQLVLGDSEGMKADMVEAKDLLAGAGWLGDNSPECDEVSAYLEWLRIRTKNKFQKVPWRPILDALADALLQSEIVEYGRAKKIIADGIQAQGNPTLIKVKKKLKGRED